MKLIRQYLASALAGWLCAMYFAGCSFNPIVIPPHDDSKDTWNRTVTEGLHRTARAGDWLVARGYKVTDHLVTTATQSPWSHVAVFDPSRDEVIEAEAKGVHVSNLVDFVAKSQHIILIRPKWRDDITGPAAVAYARHKIGKGYDFSGTIGVDVENRYYCSELAIAAYALQIGPDDNLPRIIKPSEMRRWGVVLYDSGGFEKGIAGTDPGLTILHMPGEFKGLCS